MIAAVCVSDRSVALDLIPQHGYLFVVIGGRRIRWRVKIKEEKIVWGNGKRTAKGT